MTNSSKTKPATQSSINQTPPADSTREVRVHLTHAAAKIVSPEEAPMLIKLAWKEMQLKKEYNLFHFKKLGICLIRDGDDLTIMTEREKSHALGEQAKSAEVVPEKGIAG